MKEQIQNYLEQIYSEIQESYSEEINLRESDFEMYSIFDFANFHLIYQYILDDNSDKNDFFISIPEDEYRENFFTSIFHSIVLIKLYQNFFNYEKFESSEIERNLISQRTKEALARKRAEGVILGRPIGSKSSKTKLTGQEKRIQELLDKNVSYSAIGRILGVHRPTVSSFVQNQKLQQ